LHQVGDQTKVISVLVFDIWDYHGGEM